MFQEKLDYDHPSGDSLWEQMWAILTDPPHLASEAVFEILSYSTKAAVLALFFAAMGYLGWRSRGDKKVEELERRIDELERRTA